MRRKVTSPGLATPAGLPVGLALIGAGEAAADAATVAMVMRHDLAGVAETVSAESLAGFLVERGLPGLPVVDDFGRLSGMIALSELLRERMERGDTAEALPLRAHSRGYAYDLGAGFHADPIAAATVGELARRGAPAVAPSTPLARAAALLAAEDADFLAVVDPEGRVLGTLLARDLLRWIARAGALWLADPPRLAPSRT